MARVESRATGREGRISSGRSGRPTLEEDNGPNFVERSFNFVLNNTVDKLPVKIPTVFAFLPTPIAPLAIMQRRTDVGRVFTNAATQARDIVVGLPQGLVAMALHPLDTTKAIAESYANLYGPLLHGDFQTFGDRVSEEPLSPLLDAISIVSGGAGAAVRIGGAVGKGGQISRAAKVAYKRKIKDGSDIYDIVGPQPFLTFGQPKKRGPITPEELAEHTAKRAAWQLAKDNPRDITIRLRNLGNPDGKHDIYVDNPAGQPQFSAPGRTNPVSRGAQRARSKLVTFTSEAADAVAKKVTSKAQGKGKLEWADARSQAKGSRGNKIEQRREKRAKAAATVAAYQLAQATARATPEEAAAFGIVAKGVVPEEYAAAVRQEITGDKNATDLAAPLLSYLDDPNVTAIVLDYYAGKTGQKGSKSTKSFGIMIEKAKEVAHIHRQLGLENGTMSIAEAWLTPFTTERAIIAGGKIGIEAKRSYQETLRGKSRILIDAAKESRRKKQADKKGLTNERSEIYRARSRAAEELRLMDEILGQTKRALLEAEAVAANIVSKTATVTHLEEVMRQTQTTTAVAKHRMLDNDPMGHDLPVYRREARATEENLNQAKVELVDADQLGAIAENTSRYEISKIIELDNEYNSLLIEEARVTQRLDNGGTDAEIAKLTKEQKTLANKVDLKAQKIRGAYIRLGREQTKMEIAKAKADGRNDLVTQLTEQLVKEQAQGTVKRGEHQARPYNKRLGEQIKAQRAWELEYNKLHALEAKHKHLELQTYEYFLELDQRYAAKLDLDDQHTLVDEMAGRMDALADLHEKFIEQNSAERAIIEVEKKVMRDANPSYWVHGPGALLDENLPAAARAGLEELIARYGPDVFEARELGAGIPELRQLVARGIPFYLPDKLFVQFNKEGMQHLNQGISALLGAVALDPSLLTHSYMNMVRFTQHREMLKYLEGQQEQVSLNDALNGRIKDGWEVVDKRTQERANYIANFKHTSDADTRRKHGELDPDDAQLDDLLDLSESYFSGQGQANRDNWIVRGKDGNETVTIAPTSSVVAMARESKRQATVLTVLAKKPLTIWRSIVLGTRPAFLVNNLLGNHLLYAIEWGGKDGLNGYIDMMVANLPEKRQRGTSDPSEPTPEPSGARAMDALWDAGLSGHSLDEKLITIMANGYFPTSVGTRGTFGGTQTPVRSASQNPLSEKWIAGVTFELPSIKRDQAGTRIGKKRRLIRFQDLGLGVIPATQAITETSLRQAAMYAELRGAAKAAGLVGRLARTKNVLRRSGMMSGETIDFNRLYIQMLENDPKLQAKVSNSVLEGLGNYFDLGAIERHYVRQAAPFYSWYKAITSITLRMPFDHPAKSTMLRAVAAVGIEETIADGEVPSYLLGHVDLRPGLVNAIPGLGTIAGRQPILTTNGINPFQTVAEVGEAIAGISGLGGGGVGAGLSAAAQLGNPFGTVLVEEITQRSVLTGGKSTTVVGGGFPSYVERVLRQLPPSKLITAAVKGDVTKPTYLFEKTFAKEFSSQLGIPIRNMSPEVAKKLAKEERTRRGTTEKKIIIDWNRDGS